MENYKFGSVKLELGVSGYMDILILNTYPARSSSLRDNGMGNTLVYLKEKGRKVLGLCCFARVGCLIRGKKPHGKSTWHDLCPLL